MVSPLLRRFVCSLIFVLLGWWLTAAVPRARADDVRYTFTDPGADWAMPAFDAHEWKIAPSLAALTGIWQTESAAAMWVRLTQDLTWQQIDNSYFRATHDGALDLSVNGKYGSNNTKPASEPHECRLAAVRDEVVSRNIFGLHFTAGPGPRGISVEHSTGPWVPVEERIVRARPIFPDLTRDSQACLGPDGNYYLAATSGDRDFFYGPHAWMKNEGIMLRRSPDLITWENLGWVWTFAQDATWAKNPGTFHNRTAQAVWAPEIHYFNKQYWLLYSVNFTTPKHSFGIGLLHADKSEGPWQEVSPDRPISEGYDPSLFRDDDGKVYLIRNRSLIARMKEDMSGPAEPFRTVVPSNYPCVGFEGPSLFKYKGRYYFVAAETMLHGDGQASYDAVAASSEHVYGPYGPRYIAVRYGGHNGFFVDKEGNLRATVWKLPGADLQISMPRIEVNSEGLLQPVREDCLPAAPPVGSGS